MNTMPFSVNYYNEHHEIPVRTSTGELFFILSGSAEVIVDTEAFPVSNEDVFYVSSNDTRLISGSAWEAVSITFAGEQTDDFNTHISGRFNLRSSGNTYSSKYDFLRYCIFHLVKLFYAGSSGRYEAMSILYALIDHLEKNFSYSPDLNIESNRKNQDKLAAIINYLNIHYSENLTLSHVADRFGLTSPYLSSFFKKYAAATFSDYYNEIRLSHSINDLLATNHTIEEIAEDNGFGDARSFSYTFKKKYGVLPSAYRKSHRINAASAMFGNESAHSDKETPPALYSYPSLAKYEKIFYEKEAFYLASMENPKIIDSGCVSFKKVIRPLSHTYRNMICVGSAKQLLYREVQDMLIRAKKDIDFKQIKFHGLLSDDMLAYHEDINGIPHYSFTFIDKVFDFLLSIDIRPLCQLSFMPIELAEDPYRLVDSFHYNTSPPKSLDKWSDLIIALTNHLVSRYGYKEVSSWLFCVWNEPDDTVQQFSWSDRRRFFEFYECTYRTIKSVLPDVSFGTPSMLLSIQKEYGWSAEFFRYTSEHHCTPDFLNIHYYDNSIFDKDTIDRVRGQGGFSADNMNASFPLTVDRHAFRKFIDTVKMLMHKYKMKNLPLYLTEWNLTISHRDLINDTCFKSCHLIKNLLENYDRLSSFSYWCLTDFIEELQIPNELYHGGLGLFTYNGIPKANYTALSLLSKLQNELLDKGDGYFITKSKDRICAVVYNYEHYSKLYASGARMSTVNNDRYSAFEEKNTAQATIRISDLDYSSSLVTEYYVNQLYGSSYDAWSRMEISMDMLTADELEILNRHSNPGMIVHRESIADKELTLHIKLLPLEVRVIDVKLIR